jgi:hypothetical protein
VTAAAPLNAQPAEQEMIEALPADSEADAEWRDLKLELRKDSEKPDVEIDQQKD